MPRRVTRAEAVAAVARVAGERPDATVWIGIDGPGGTGKSSLTRAIADAVPRSVVVPVDHFSGPDVPQWDWPRFLDEVVAPLRAGRRARYREWTWDRPQAGASHEVMPGSVVVVEGVSSTRDEATVPWDLRIWVDAPKAERLARIRARDGEAVMPRWLHEWIPSEERYLAAQRPDLRADLIITGVVGAVRDAQRHA